MKNNSHTQNCAYIALGSNLNNPLKQVIDAVTLIDSHPDMCVKSCSSWYKNPALTLEDSSQDNQANNDYINGVIKIETPLSPMALLDLLQSIETQQGRTSSTIRWQARTLDLDILLYNSETIESPRLTIPHTQMTLRAFVLHPLYEIEPDLKLPNGVYVKQLITQVTDKALEKINVSS